jgi:SAM-dependent methyltransferase
VNHIRLCPACDGRILHPFQQVQPENLLRCSSCGLVFETRSPTLDELNAHYGHYSYSQLKTCPNATRQSFRQVLQSLAPWRGRGRLLDLGCGQGDFLVEATAAHWQAMGMEFSDSAVSLCRSRGLEVFQGSSATTALNNRKFDVITAFEVLEHLRAPGDLLSDSAKLLDDGGILYLTTPNLNAFLRYFEGDNFAPVSYPDHLCFFTLKSLRNLANRHGFRVAAVRTSGLDPFRLKRCLMNQQSLITPDQSETPRSQVSCSDLREAAFSHPSIALLKASVNTFLNMTGTGDTLKAWLVKL